MQAPHEQIKKRLNIAKGQLEGIIRMVDEDRYCIDISNQLMAVSQALRGINRDVLSNHLHSCVLDSLNSHDEEDMILKMDEITRVIEKLSK